MVAAALFKHGKLLQSAPISSTVSPAAFSARKFSDSFPARTPPSFASDQSQEEGSKRSWSRFLLFIPGAITFALGSWQILRRQDKVKLLEYRRKRLELKPLAKGAGVFNISSSQVNSDALEFRKVKCEGHFDEEKSIYVGPRSRSISGVTKNGYYVITPLIPSTSDPNSVLLPPILVNRGWVPRDWKNKPLSGSRDSSSNLGSLEVEQKEETNSWKFWSRKPVASKTEEKIPAIKPVRVTGVVRGSEKPSIFVPENDPESGQWFYVDVPMIARACGLPEDALYIEDIGEDRSATDPYPVPKDVNDLIRFSVMPQDHLNYTFTWYSLSAAVTFMAYKRISPRKIRRKLL